MKLKRIIKIVWLVLLITFLFKLFINGEFYFDFATSVIPGWHTPIFPTYSIYYILINPLIILLLIFCAVIIFNKRSTYNTIVKVAWILLFALVLFVIGIYLKVSIEVIPGWHATILPPYFLFFYLLIVILLILGAIIIFRKNRDIKK